VLLVVCPLFFLVPTFGDGTERDPLRILTSWLLLPHPEPPVLPVAWSLRHEVLFYAVFSLLVVRPRWGIAALVAWEAGVVAKALSGWPRGFPFDFLFDLRNFDFALGLAAALAVRGGKLPRPGLVAVLGSLGLGALALMDTRLPGRLNHSACLVLYGALSALVVAGLGTSDLRGSVRYPAWLRLLGAASYSVYLVHLPVLSLVAKLGAFLRLPAHLPVEFLFLLYAPVATAAGVALHLLIEKPVTLRLRDRFLPAGARPPGVPLPATAVSRAGGTIPGNPGD
jgi:exopolysaccharide production protein ExoZ